MRSKLHAFISISKGKIHSILLIILFSLLNHVAFANDNQSDFKPLTLSGPRVHEIHSDIVNESYSLYVNLPATYSADNALNYPTIYVLDGQWDFTLAKDIYGKTRFDGTLPEAIIVGITWAAPNANYGALRSRDFLPHPVQGIPMSGGGVDFLNALKHEIIPFINGRYPSSDERVLMGSSFGALFTTYTMLEQPDLFGTYIAVAGAYNIDQEYFSTRLAEISGSKKLKGVRAYFGVGSLDVNSYDVVTGFYQQLKDVRLKGFKSKLKIARGFGHAGAALETYSKGLQYAFKRPRLKLDADTMASYEGEYQSVDGFLPFTVKANKRHLVLSRPGAPDFIAYALSETRFYVEGIDVEAEFVVENGCVSKMTVYWQGSPFDYVRQ